MNTLTGIKPEISKTTLDEHCIHGIGFELVYERKILFDLDLAQKFINMPAFCGERLLRDRHVDHLLHEAKRGSFLYDVASLVSCDCRYDGVERRLNGQHTAWMRTFLGPNLDAKIRVIKFVVDTEDDFRKLYAAIDRGATRTPAHVMQARLFGTDEFEGISMDTIALLQKGFKLLSAANAEELRSKGQTDELANKLLGSHHTIALLVARLIEELGIQRKQATVKHMRRSAVCAALFMTLAKARGEAAEFWSKVTTGLELTDPRDARYKLREYLLRVDLSTEHSPKRKRVSAEEMLRVCISAWNHYRKGEPVQVLVSAKSRQAAK